jgi:hypothetical protein
MLDFVVSTGARNEEDLDVWTPTALRRPVSAATIGLGIGVGTVWAALASPQERVEAAYKAMGMTDAITTLIVKDSMQARDPGESASVSDPYKPNWGISVQLASLSVIQADVRLCAFASFCSRPRHVRLSFGTHREGAQAKLEP